MTEQEIPTFFDSPESSTIVSARYDPDRQVLTVEFKRKPKEKTAGCYIFGGVERELWAEFFRSSSKGHFFATRIRPSFSGVAQV